MFHDKAVANVNAAKPIHRDLDRYMSINNPSASDPLFVRTHQGGNAQVHASTFVESGGFPISAWPAPSKDKRAQGYKGFGKRALDLTLCVLILPFLLLVLAILIPLARLDGGPALYRQERVGRNGERFWCWKLRTMVTNGDQLLADYLAKYPAAKQEWEERCKLTNDPRITTVGRFLRKTSLDELPQIWNVLNGEMSLVGPRPVPECELSRYGPLKASYMSLRPGVTGIWQVYGRTSASYDERVLMDAEYANSLSLFKDLGLILKTVHIVFARTGQ